MGHMWPTFPIALRLFMNCSQDILSASWKLHCGFFLQSSVCSPRPSPSGLFFCPSPSTPVSSAGPHLLRSFLIPMIADSSHIDLCISSWLCFPLEICYLSVLRSVVAEEMVLETGMGLWLIKDGKGLSWCWLILFCCLYAEGMSSTHSYVFTSQSNLGLVSSF